MFDAEGFNPPFDPLRTSPDEGYTRQVRYVDSLFARLAQHMRDDGTYDDTTIVVGVDPFLAQSATRDRTRLLAQLVIALDAA